jgi:hypothetical protein
MDKSAFQLFKNTARSNTNAWLHNVPLIDFGRVITVIDIQTVVVEAIIQTALSKERYTVSLLNLSSNLLEISDEPKIGDTVLLLFLRKHDPRMFISETIQNAHATGYNKFSGVGILMSTAKKVAHTIISCYDDDGKPVTDITSDAELYGAFNNVITMAFCRAVFDSDDEQLITLVFGTGRPFIEKHLARIEREYGFWKDPDNELIEMDASVTEKYSKFAPITRVIQGAQTTVVGLGTDKDAHPIETDAPIVETIHGKSPITRDIRSPQTVIVGIGNAENDDAEEERDAAVNETYGTKAPITKDIRGSVTYKIGTGKDGATEAPVNIDLDEKSDVTITSKSGLTMSFEKAVLIQSDDTFKLKITGAVTLQSDDKIVLDAAGDIEVNTQGNAKVAATGNVVVDATGDADIKAKGKIYIGNTAYNALAMMKDLIAKLKAAKTYGPPGMHTMDPSTILELTALETQIGLFLK